jgi:hypothetical protein
MKKLLFFPLILLVLFTVTSCNDDDDDTPAPVFTETEQMLFGNWRMHSLNYDFFDDNDEVVHNEQATNLNNLFEFRQDGTVRFKGEEAENWDTRKYEVAENGGVRTLTVMNASGGTDNASVYTIETLTATELVLTEAYDYETYMKDGEEHVSRRVEKTFEYSKL